MPGQTCLIMDYLKKREIVLNGNLKKAIWLLAYPLMFTNLMQTVYNLADIFWLGRLGKTEVASVILVFPVIFLMLSLGVGINVAGNALISQYIGASQAADGKKVAGQVFSFTILFSLITGIFGYFISPAIVGFLGAKGELFKHAVCFLKILFLGSPTIFIFFAFLSIEQAQGDTITPMRLTLVSVILNIILDPLLIFGLKLGVAGAALATIISRGFLLIWAVYILFFETTGIRLSLSSLKLNWKVLSWIIKIGIPASAGQSGAAMGFIMLNGIVLSFGENPLASFGVANRILSIFMMPAMGIGSACSTVVGQNLGAGNEDRANESVYIASSISCMIMLLGGIILYPLAPMAIKIFINNPEVIKEGSYYLRLFGMTLPMIGIFDTIQGAFQGAGRTFTAMVFSLGRLWILRIPIIFLLKLYPSLGSYGIWYSMVISNVLVAIACYIWFRKGKWAKSIIQPGISVQDASDL